MIKHKSKSVDNSFKTETFSLSDDENYLQKMHQVDLMGGSIYKPILKQRDLNFKEKILRFDASISKS